MNKKANMPLAIIMTVVLIGIFVIPFFWVFNNLASDFLGTNPSMITLISFYMFPVFVIIMVIYYALSILRGGGL